MSGNASTIMLEESSSDIEIVLTSFLRSYKYVQNLWYLSVSLCAVMNSVHKPATEGVGT